jgi:hypothetical protein
MTKPYNDLRSEAYPVPIETYEVDGVPLSAEEVNLAKLLLDKLARTAAGSVIDFDRASKRRLKYHENLSRWLNADS